MTTTKPNGALSKSKAHLPKVRDAADKALQGHINLLKSCADSGNPPPDDFTDFFDSTLAPAVTHEAKLATERVTKEAAKARKAAAKRAARKAKREAAAGPERSDNGKGVLIPTPVDPKWANHDPESICLCEGCLEAGRAVVAADGQAIAAAPALPEKLEKAAEQFATDVATTVPAKAAVAKLEKAVTDKAPKALSPTAAIRAALAADHTVTEDAIVEALGKRAMHPPRSTVRTVRLDFLGCLRALQQAGRIK